MRFSKNAKSKRSCQFTRCLLVGPCFTRVKLSDPSSLRWYGIFNSVKIMNMDLWRRKSNQQDRTCPPRLAAVPTWRDVFRKHISVRNCGCRWPWGSEGDSQPPFTSMLLCFPPARTDLKEYTTRWSSRQYSLYDSARWQPQTVVYDSDCWSSQTVECMTMIDYRPIQ